MSELQEKIKECNYLYDELSKRPVKVVAKADLNSYDNHADRSRLILEKLEKHELYFENVKFKNSAAKVQVVANNDLIFFGIVVKNLVGKEEVKVNELVEFQSCDCLDVDECFG